MGRLIEGPFLILSSDPAERLWLAKKQLEGRSFRYFSLNNLSASQITHEVSALSLFGNEWDLIDAIEEWKGEFPLHPQQIFLGSERPSFAKGMKGIDFTKEKPWDRKARLADYVVSELKAQGKAISSPDAAVLVERVRMDFAALEQEMAKLIANAGEGKSIKLADIEALVAEGDSFSLRRHVQDLLYTKGAVKPVDQCEFFPLLAVLRSETEMALMVSEALERGEDPSIYLGRAPLKIAQLITDAARRLTSRFFSRILDLLFEIELQAKTTSLDADLLYHLLVIKIENLKHAPLPSPQPR